MDMETKRIENNQVTISGEIVRNFEFSHEIYGEKFYIASLESKRDSGTKDIIPIMVSERLVDVKKDWTGKFVRITGQFRSYNKYEQNKRKLILFVFAEEFEAWKDNEDERTYHKNRIFLDGFICKEPRYRNTPNGKEISDVLLAVNRQYRKSDYIPCICWGRNARFASNLEVGTRLKVWGRIQSREYQKRTSDDEIETKIAYEVSIQKMEVVEDEQREN